MALMGVGRGRMAGARRGLGARARATRGFAGWKPPPEREREQGLHERVRRRKGKGRKGERDGRGRASGESLNAGKARPLRGDAEPHIKEVKARGEAGETEKERARRVVDAFVRFTRPHTMMGTAISVTSVSLLALRNSADIGGAFVASVVIALVAALAMNISIVGLNQVYDVDIDKVNKPYLPLASGEFSEGTGKAIVLGTALFSLAIGVASGSLPLMLTLVASLLLGIFYSADLPLLRWKRFPVLAAMCILAVRAVIVQLGFFNHVRSALTLHVGSVVKDRFEWASSLGLVFGTGFMVLFSVAIALFKDLPDIVGDEKAGIKTLSVVLGRDFVFRACNALLMAAYASAVAVGLFCTNVWWSKAITVGAHSILGLALVRRSRDVDLSSSDSLYSFYMFIWKLFYAEYLLLPFIR